MSRGRPRKLSPAEQHEIRRYREAGVSIERLANMWSISKQTIYRVLAEQRAKLGLEQLPNKHLARAHLFTSGQVARENSDTSRNSNSSST